MPGFVPQSTLRSYWIKQNEAHQQESNEDLTPLRYAATGLNKTKPINKSQMKI
jgi:hypothetical protein